MFNEVYLDYYSIPFEIQMKIFIHELFHSLFFNPWLFKNFFPKYNDKPYFFKDSDGKQKLQGPFILEQMRKHFNCESISGGKLEI